MKLTKIQGHESTKKVQYSWKATTTDMLDQYAAFYKAQTGIEVPLKDITEQMVLDFMREDKAFQKFAAAAKKQASAPAPAAAANQKPGIDATPAPASSEKPAESGGAPAPGYGLSGSAPSNRNT